MCLLRVSIHIVCRPQSNQTSNHRPANDTNDRRRIWISDRRRRRRQEKHISNRQNESTVPTCRRVRSLTPEYLHLLFSDKPSSPPLGPRGDSGVSQSFCHVTFTKITIIYLHATAFSSKQTQWQKETNKTIIVLQFMHGILHLKKSVSWSSEKVPFYISKITSCYN